MAVLLLVLGLVWVAALTPVIIRKVSEHRLDVSVARYRLSTSLLRRVRPAGFTEMTADERVSTPQATVPRAQVQRARRERVLARERIERRVRTLRTLAIVIGATFILGLIPPMRTLWYISLAASVTGAAYIGAIAYVTRHTARAAAQARKIVVLRPWDEKAQTPLTLVAAGSSSRPVANGGSEAASSAAYDHHPTFRILERSS